VLTVLVDSTLEPDRLYITRITREYLGLEIGDLVEVSDCSDSKIRYAKGIQLAPFASSLQGLDQTVDLVKDYLKPYYSDGTSESKHTLNQA